MARLTRRELKEDEFRTSLEEFEAFAKENYKTLIVVAVTAIVLGGSALGYRLYSQRQEADANALLGAALATFRAPVGSPQPSPGGLDSQTFATSEEKYKKALQEFSEVARKYPRQKAAALARYHAGLCQAELGDQAGAFKSLQEASHTSDREIASLAQLALAGELLKSGKLADAVKICQQLADHPTLSVPRATALLALAHAYRDTQPAQARAIYEKMEKEFASSSYLAATVKQELASLPK